MSSRVEAHRRPDVRRRHRHHELLDLEQRRIRGIRDRTEDHHRGNQAGHAFGAQANPVGRVCEGFHPGESRWRTDAPFAAPHHRRASDRGRRREVEGDDALDQEEQAGGSVAELGARRRTGSREGSPVMSASYPYPIIAREGWPYLPAAIVAAWVAAWV